MNEEEKQKLDKQIRESFLKDREEAAELRDEMNKHLFEVRSKNLTQRRDLLKHITLISAAILGLVTIVANAPLIKAYFITGVSLHMAVIVLIFSYLREHLDKESNELQFQQDEYNEVIQEKLDLIDEYLSKLKLTEELTFEYFKKLHSSPRAEQLVKSNYELSQKRKDRKNQPLDYFSELVVFIFLSASFFILASFSKEPFNIYILTTVIALFAFLSFFNSVIFLSKHLSRLITFLKLLPKKEIELRRIDELTIGNIMEDETKLILRADKRYGAFFKNAADFNALLHAFIKTVDIEGWLFAMFLSQVRKHHTLALFSAVRRHHTQAQMNLRQTMEAGANAAYAIANPQKEDFVVVLPGGTLDAPQSLAEKRYKWLEDNFQTSSDFLKNQKKISNSATHSNVIYAFLNFSFDEVLKRGFNTPFFDIEDEYLIKTDLWFIGNLAMGLMDLFFGVNQKHSIITFADDFIPRLKTLEAQNLKLKEEMMKHPRFRKTMTRQRGENGF